VILIDTVRGSQLVLNRLRTKVKARCGELPRCRKVNVWGIEELFVATLQILIVDDQPQVRSGIRRLLSKHQDWNVCGEACDGLEAIQKAEEFKPDVVLLDVSMPKMDGLTALPRILEKSPDSQIIVLTLHESLDAARAASSVGAHAYVTKSLMKELLPVMEALQTDETRD
jgi:YesN/AraC family two-component response regulator